MHNGSNTDRLWEHKVKSNFQEELKSSNAGDQVWEGEGGYGGGLRGRVGGGLNKSESS